MSLYGSFFYEFPALYRNQLVGSVVEGLEAFGSPLPLRKRKIGITEVVHTKRRSIDVQQESAGGYNSITSGTAGAAGSTSKRRRLTSNSSNSDARYAVSLATYVLFSGHKRKF